VDAPPGLLTALDLPLITGRGMVRPAVGRTASTTNSADQGL